MLTSVLVVDINWEVKLLIFSNVELLEVEKRERVKLKYSLSVDADGS